MWIGSRLHARRLLGGILAPNLGVAQEELLLRRKAVLLPGHMARQAVHERGIREADAAIIRGVLSQSKFSVHIYTGHRAEAIVLLRNAPGPRLEGLAVLSRPPVTQVTLTIVLAPLIVETMRQFVANHCAYTAIIHGIAGLWIVERRLQDAGRKVDVIHVRRIIS